MEKSFPLQQFAMHNFEIRVGKHRDCHGGGLIEFVRKDLICESNTLGAK